MRKKTTIYTLIIILIAAYIVAQYLYSTHYARSTAKLQTSADSFKKSGSLGTGSTYSLFVAGDSIGVGLGAGSFETSVAGRVVLGLSSNHIVQFRNVSVSGARLADVAQQPLPKTHQQAIVIVGSSNDLFHFTKASKFETNLRGVLARYSPLTDRLVIIGPGAIDQAGAVPKILDPLYFVARPLYVRRLKIVSAEFKNVSYVDNLDISPQFKTGFPADITSPVDKFHLNDEGHRWWAELILQKLR